MRIGRLHIGKVETNESNRFLLASWRHRSGYWRWLVRWSPAREGMRLRFGPGMDSGKRYAVGGKGNWHFSVWVTVPFVGFFGFRTQPPKP